MRHKKSGKPCDRSEMSNPLFHYTVGIKMRAIFRTGALLPTGIGIDEGEQPALWLSHNPVMEPTARKAGVGPDGVFRILTMRETHEMCGGLFRFRVKSKVQTHNLREFKEMSGISDATFRDLVISGRRQKASPQDWRVTFEPINLGDIEEIQEWDGSTWKYIGASIEELREIFLNKVEPERQSA